MVSRSLTFLFCTYENPSLSKVNFVDCVWPEVAKLLSSVSVQSLREAGPLSGAAVPPGAEFSCAAPLEWLTVSVPPCPRRSFVIQQIPSSNLFMVVVDSGCLCEAVAPITMAPIEIRYILWCGGPATTAHAGKGVSRRETWGQGYVRGERR